jgi:N-glycosylase/DNA lyase
MALFGTDFSLPARDYDLAATLSCGQAFRWREVNGGWEGVVAARWLQVSAGAESLRVRLAEPVPDDQWVLDHLQSALDLEAVIRSFPDDEPMRAAVAACRGLRLLRQEPWECLASFILSSTKQIVQIRQIIELLCARFGEPVLVPAGHAPVFAFPTAERLAQCGEAELRECKMGFRAPYLRATAALVARGEVDLAGIAGLDCDAARAELLLCPGVGRKIADCVLLFAYGFQAAFPVDVWVLRALRQLYFPRRRPSPKRLLQFTATYFGPNAGFAQQYLFHYMRLQAGRAEGAEGEVQNAKFKFQGSKHAYLVC